MRSIFSGLDRSKFWSLERVFKVPFVLSLSKDRPQTNGGSTSSPRTAVGFRHTLLGLAGAALLLTLAACGGPADDENPTPGAQNQIGDPGRLTIYSGRSETLVDPIIQQFASVSGVDVEVRYAGTPQLAATLLEEGRNSPADLFFAQDPGGLGAVEDMLATLPRETLDRVPEWAQSPDDKWVGISGRARVVVYNTDRLTEADLPDDVTGFTDPEWQGRIGWAPTNSSFQTMVTGMRAVWGEAETRQWLEGIQANNPQVYPNNTSQVVAAGAGEIDVGLVNHYYLFRLLAEEGEGFAARNYHPRAGGPGAMIMVAGAGILSSGDNPENAQKFLDFMLSTVAQQYFTSQTYEYPLVEGVQTEPLLTPLDQIINPGIPLRDLTDLEGTQTMLREAGILP